MEGEVQWREEWNEQTLIWINASLHLRGERGERVNSSSNLSQGPSYQHRHSLHCLPSKATGSIPGLHAESAQLPNLWEPSCHHSARVMLLREKSGIWKVRDVERGQRLVKVRCSKAVKGCREHLRTGVTERLHRSTAPITNYESKK